MAAGLAAALPGRRVTEVMATIGTQSTVEKLRLECTNLAIVRLR